MKWILKIWHDIYYYFESKQLEKAALTCREAVTQLEMSDDQLGMQLTLHLSLCESCRSYHRFSKSFRGQHKDNPMHAQSQQKPEINLDALSLKLMNQFSTLEVRKKL